MQNKYMLKAISLAKKGRGYVNPNPMVGAVLVKDNKIIGQGYHHRYGDLHAERDAIKDCLDRGNNPAGADLYVTLEPCCHTGKQPPCTHAIVENGISRVFVGSRDPNPLVAGKGVKYLELHGVQVVQDVLKEQCDAINQIFFHYITRGTPYVILKYAMTCDGKIAGFNGEGGKISGIQSLRKVHEIRAACSGILVGVNTVISDNPSLNTRLVKGKSPRPVVMDSRLVIPLDCKLVVNAAANGLIVACCNPDVEKQKMLESLGVTVLIVKESLGMVNVEDLLVQLGKLGMDSVLVEGGARVHGSFARLGLFNELITFTAPKVTCTSGISPMEGTLAIPLEQSRVLKLVELKNLGGDVMARYVPCAGSR